VAKNNTTFRLKDVKELTYAAFGKITKDVWTRADEHVVKIEKEYCKENCIDRRRRFLILHVRVNYQFYLFYKLLGSFFVLFFHIIQR
jgi:hypothetical protein